MSCAVNNATSGGAKVLSVARLEMVKYRTKGSKWSYLEDNSRVSGNTEIGRPMAVVGGENAFPKECVLKPEVVTLLRLIRTFTF